MKKINFFFIFGIILLVNSFQLINATVTEENNFKYAYYDSNENLIKTNTPVNGVNAIAFVCADSACTSFSKTLWGKSTSSSSLIFTYPETLQGEGYAVYIYKNGYIPYERKVTYDGTGTLTNTDYLTRKQSCISTINNFDVSVSGQTVNVNAVVDSPIDNAGPLKVIPAELTNHYSTKVDINLEIKNSNEDIIYTEIKQKTIDFSENSQVSFSRTLSPGDYTIRVYTSLDNEEKCLSYNFDLKTGDIHINEPDTNPEINSVSANPSSGVEPLTVSFSCSASSGNGQLSYHWSFGDGESSDLQNPSHTYTNFGSYTAACTVRDSDNDEDSATVSINVIEDKKPTITTISATPDSGVVPLDVDFTCQASGGDGTLSYSWSFGDGESSDLQNPSHTYTNFGSYTAACTVEDSDGDSDSATVNIGTEKDTLEITDLTCFENVIENNNQSCSIYVENSFGNPASDSEVKVYYNDGSLFGKCTTDSISGGCSVKDLQETVGNFTVYAIATKNGSNPDLDKNPKFSYSVLEEKYEIKDLKVFNDSEFLNEDYDFYRGEGFYVSFKVIGDNGPAEDMVTKATLVSLPGGRADLGEIENSNGEYFYKLNLIPLTHDFFGDSNIFAFAFNFTDGSGGQSEVNLIIRNNLPWIEGMDDEESVYIDKEITIDLEDYENDLEDSGDDLTWEVIEESDYFDAAIDRKVLTIKGIEKGTEELTLRLYDLDNDYAEANISITVKKNSGGGGGGGGGSNNIIGHREIFEPVTPGFSGIGYFIEEEEEKEIEDSAFVKFLKQGYGLLLMFLLLLILLILLLIAVIKKKK
ncbi:MAG: PKD domain-containing protein [Candidatus Pacearchaeota archaeon]|jgi:PKD repeat protein